SVRIPVICAGASQLVTRRPVLEYIVNMHFASKYPCFIKPPPQDPTGTSNHGLPRLVFFRTRCLPYDHVLSWLGPISTYVSCSPLVHTVALVHDWSSTSLQML